MSETYANPGPMRSNPIRVLLVKLLNCCTSGSGAAAQPGGGFYEGHWGGATPPVTPTAEPATGVDLDTGRIWWYYNAQWN